MIIRRVRSIDLDLTGYAPGTWKSFEIPISDLLLSTNAEQNNPPVDV